MANFLIRQNMIMSLQWYTLIISIFESALTKFDKYLMKLFNVMRSRFTNTKS